MVILVVLLALAFLAVLAVILLRRAGGGRFPWLQFYMKGRESGFLFHEINLLRRVAIESKLENPTALFWSMKQLDRALKGTIIRYRARSQEQDPEYNHLLSKLFELRKRVEFDQPKYKMGIKSSRKLMPKQSLRITLPGLGPFLAIVVENLSRYMAVSRPQGPNLPDGFSWKNQKVGIYLWRSEDAGYFFQTKVLEDFIDRKYPIIHIAHSDNLVRTQKRNSLRVETDMTAELFPLKTIDQATEVPEQSRGAAMPARGPVRGRGRHPHRRQGARRSAHQGPVHPGGEPGHDERGGEGNHVRPEEEPLAPAHAGGVSRHFHEEPDPDIRLQPVRRAGNDRGGKETRIPERAGSGRHRAQGNAARRRELSGAASLRGSSPADPEPPGS